jgi:hypothetical protein
MPYLSVSEAEGVIKVSLACSEVRTVKEQCEVFKVDMYSILRPPFGLS